MPPLLINGGTGECRPLDIPGRPLGDLPQLALEEKTVKMGAGDLLLLYTDGIPNASSPEGASFSAERLREIACTAGTAGAESICDRIIGRVDEFQAGTAQEDDLTVLVLQADSPE
jgi:sigma-B regulation protein RsbU (phosphoserine phosphatase)